MNTRQNLVITFVQRHIQMLIAAASVMVLARLVSPNETGIFSIGLAVTALTHAVRDFGVGNFLIKEPEATREKIRTAFTVSLLIAVTLSILLLAVSGSVARFYGQREVAYVIRITTVGLLISPLSTVNLALLLREHRFYDMFKVSLVGNLAGTAVSIIGAWQGLGATALALGSLANSIGLVVAANLVLPRYGDYLPSLTHWRPISRFGLHSTVSGVSEQIGGRASDLILGKVIGFGAVAILSRAGTLITMFQDSVISATAPVVLATMADDARKDVAMSAAVLTSIEYATILAWPFFALLAIFSNDAVLLLFGTQWMAAASYTSILCCAAALAILPTFSGIASTAAGRVDLLSRYNLASQGIRVILIALGALSGLHMVALLLVVAAAIQCIFASVFLHRVAPISAGEFARRSWRSLAVTAIVVAAVEPVYLWAGNLPVFRILLAVAVAAIVWTVAVVVVRHPVVSQLTSALIALKNLLVAKISSKSRAGLSASLLLAANQDSGRSRRS